MPTLILPCFAISIDLGGLSAAVAASRRDAVIPPVRQTAMLSGTEGSCGAGEFRFGISHQQALRADLDRGDAVVQAAQVVHRLVVGEIDGVALKLLVLEHPALGLGL